MGAIKYTRPVLPRPNPPVPPPIPIPLGFVPIPSTDLQEKEFIKDGIIYDGVTGYPIINAETKEQYYRQH